MQLAILENDIPQVATLCAEAKRYVQRWIENDPGEGLVHLTKRIKLNVVPGISALKLDPEMEFKIREKPARVDQ